MDIDNLKIVLFDFDNTLCVHTDHKKWTESQKNAARAKLVSEDLSMYDGCKINDNLRKFMELLQTKNIRIGLLSTVESHPWALMKQRFVRERYHVKLENFCVGTQEGKLDMLNAIADSNGYSKQEVAIVDDYWYQLERASDAGFAAYSPLEIVNYINESEKERNVINAIQDPGKLKTIETLKDLMANVDVMTKRNEYKDALQQAIDAITANALVFSELPLCVVEDRYGGAYSNAAYLAFNMTPYDVSELDFDSGDMLCMEFWENEAKDYVIGKGDTPIAAVIDLKMKLCANDQHKE